ncbi:MAG: hypothetical protein IT512_02120 [Rhodocyclaceae bacterium]|nr:hypothetical protein [Rhodocyclaceae bacterium]
MAKFIAIPVGQGDAFYLNRGDSSILIDGGRSRVGFPSLFQTITKADGADIVVCTHNDADHANGILGFLEAGFRCGELWLPGRWLEILPDLQKPAGEMLEVLAKQIAEINPSCSGAGQADFASLESIAEKISASSENCTDSDDDVSIDENGWHETLARVMEQADPWDAPRWVPMWPPEDWVLILLRRQGRLDANGVRLLWSAIDAASRIREIALIAYHQGIPIRWFQFDPNNPSGGNAALQPVNSKQIARVRPNRQPLLQTLALTVSNKESLVFWSPPTAQHAGVLFTADSDLAGVTLPSPLVRAIATAPHHGSDANNNAYAVLASSASQDFPSITWVRSDGRCQSRPGNGYSKLTSRRYCTLCRKAAIYQQKQAVRLYSRHGKWVRHPATRRCTC